MASIRRRGGSVSTTSISFPAMTLSYIALFAWTFVVLFPLYWLAVTALKTPLEVNGGPFYIPWRDFQPTLDSWHYIFFDLREDTFRPYTNTVVVGLTSTAITVLLGSMAAYALVRMRYQVGFGAIGSFVIALAIAVVVVYIFFQQLQLLDTWAALIITYTAAHLPIVVWLMRDYFQSVPVELEESAAIDGASPYRIFRSIVLPLAVPGLVATFLFVLVFAWNEYLIALFLTSANAQTLPLTVAAQNATRGPQWWYMSVLILIMIGPVIAMAIALERYIAKGLLVGAVKG